MSTTPTAPSQTMPPAADSVSSWRMIATMAGIGLISAILIVLTFQLTLPIIERNKAAALERAIFEVIPGAATKKAFVTGGDGLVPMASETASRIYYACYDESGKLAGVAVEASGQGFQDILHILYGYSPQRGEIVGMKVLESKETPGLGDKIESDADFRANFDALSVKLDDAGTAIEHPAELVKHGAKTDPWQVEAITGATISSRAITNILRESTAETVPEIHRELKTLEGGGQ